MSGTQQQPQQPRLQPIPLVAESYQVASVPAVSTKLLNMYAEQLPPGSRSTHMLRPTAGTDLIATLGSGPVHVSATLAGSYYAVSGDHAWRLQDTGPGAIPHDYGAVGTAAPADSETIAIGLTSVVFCIP